MSPWDRQFCLPALGFTNLHYHTPRLNVGSGNLNRNPHDCVTITLPYLVVSPCLVLRFLYLKTMEEEVRKEVNIGEPCRGFTRGMRQPWKGEMSQSGCQVSPQAHVLNAGDTI